MKTDNKGNVLTIIIVVIAVIVLGYVLLSGKKAGAPATGTITETPTENAGTPASATLEDDLAKADANMTALNDDGADIDAGLNDKPVPQP